MNDTPSDMSPAACPWCQPQLAYNTMCRLHFDHYTLRWKRLGFSIDDYHAWASSVSDATNAAAYRDAGMNPAEAHTWQTTTQLPATSATAWHATGLTPDKVAAWLNVRVVTTVDDYQALAPWHTPTSAVQLFGAKQDFNLGRYHQRTDPSRRP